MNEHTTHHSSGSRRSRRAFGCLLLGGFGAGLAALAAPRTITVTAYCPCSRCCGQWAGGRTASGTVPTEGRTVAATPDFRFGQRVKLFGRIYVVEDRMSRRYRRDRIDIYMTDHNSAVKFGVKKVRL